MNIIGRNYLLSTALLTILVGGLGGWAYYSAFPHHYFRWYPLIPIFFYVFGVFMASMLKTFRQAMPGRMLQIYIRMRSMRMVASFFIMVGYCVVVGEEIKEFLLAFIANYLTYLIYDSWFYLNFEASRKLKKKE